MQIKHRALQKDSAGSIKVIAEDDEDIWHLYNLIMAGDEAGNREDGKTERVKVTLTLRIEGIEYAGDSECRCKGRCASENQHVEMGSYHTISLVPQMPITLTKRRWDRLDIARLDEAADSAAHADLAIALVAEGLAHVCLVGRSATLLRAKVEVAMPKKRGAASLKGHADAESRFLRRAAAAITQHVDMAIVRCLLIAGPGFARDKVREHLLAHGGGGSGNSSDESGRGGAAYWQRHRGKLVSAPASTAYLQAIPELLSGGGVAKQVADTKAAREVAALEEFYTMLGNDASRAFYGPGHVVAAAQEGAIAKLLIADSLYRVHEAKARQRWIDVVDAVEAAGGSVFLFSARHESGKQLEALSGVAAVLRFGMPGLEDEDPAALLARLQL